MSTNSVSGAERGHLVSYYQTISEQLNARLTESPRFFGVVVVASTAYGYVIWNGKAAKSIDFFFLGFSSLVFYVVILWAIWYLLALGYAFRYLQFSQHRIEDDLGWDVYRSKETGNPPGNIKGLKDLFWVLPGIYHAHLGGLITIIFLLFSVFILQAENLCMATLMAFPFLVIAAFFTWWVGFHYLEKIRRVHNSRKEPAAPN